MARTPSYDSEELERLIGPRGPTPINSANRALVQNWLVAKGFAAVWTKSCRVSTLYKAYNRPAYFAKLAELRDSGELYRGKVVTEEGEPSMAEPATHIPPIGGGEGVFVLTPPATAGTATRTRATTPAEMAEMFAPAPPTKPASDGADAKLAAAAEALRAAAMLLDGKGAEALGLGGDSIPAPTSHGAGTIPGTTMIRAADLFPGVAKSIMVPRFEERSEYVPEIDAAYNFDPTTTTAILLGFAHNRRVLISGRHGTGKTSHVEQIAARLNWPCLRLNFDGHLSRTDLIGRDAIVLKEDKQVTEFREGILPWAMQQPFALCLDEYDAGRPDVLFVVQRLLEASGKLTIAEQNRVIEPHCAFRLFGTANTVGLGDASGLYHGTNPLNAAQMDRWSIAVRLDYLPLAEEIKIVRAKCPHIDAKTARRMVRTATATRALFAANKISTVMSPRTVITWAENAALLAGDLMLAFQFTFLNKCDDAEQPNILTCYSESFARAEGDD